MERGITNTKGEVNGVRATPGWQGVSVQIHSGAIDTVAPMEIAKAFETKEPEMSKRGIGYVAASGSSIENAWRRRLWATPTTEKV